MVSLILVFLVISLLVGMIIKLRNAPVSSPQPSETSRMDPKQKAQALASLTPEQRHVTQSCGTEPPFQNAYWNSKEPGIYVDVVSGEPLFSSTHKFDSGSGWPSFDRPLEKAHVAEKRDATLGMERVEVRSTGGNSHLGHVFPDGPPTTGLRYCINSAALRFVPKDRLIAEGYGEYLPQFNPAVEVVVLAGGCFWGMEDLLRKIPGVLQTRVGYAGGDLAFPKYTDVKTGRTGHAEAVQVVFDSRQITLTDLLTEHFFKMHDPTTVDRQGNDVGTQYRSVIFASNDTQKTAARSAIERVVASGKWSKPIVTQIEGAVTFWKAEEFHQDYLEKNPGGYTCHFYR